MYRVLLKIETIHIRIKEQVEIQCVICKNELRLQHSRATLLNGIANVNSSQQFLITKISPNFEVQVLLLIGGGKKKIGGSVEINLTPFQLDHLHFLTHKLQKTLDRYAHIDLTLLLCEINVLGQYILISTNDYETATYQQQLATLQRENIELQSENNHLNEEVTQLRIRNEGLTKEKRDMEAECAEMERQHQGIMGKCREEEAALLGRLEKEKLKIAGVVDIFNESGESALIEQVEEILRAQSH